jgi:hypothetical protein
MGQIIKPNFELPYKSLMFYYENYDNSVILYNDTNLNFTITSGGTGFLIIGWDLILIAPNNLFVNVLPTRDGNNHSINLNPPAVPIQTLSLVCCENNNNSLTDAGFNGISVEIKFFNI